MHDLFLFMAKRSQPWKKSNECVLKYEPYQSEKCNNYEVWKVKLSHKLVDFGRIGQLQGQIDV